MSSLGVCVVTGAASPTGTAICRALLEAGVPTDRLRALDTEAAIAAHCGDRTSPDGLALTAVPLADPALIEHLRGARHVVHVAAADDLAAQLPLPANDRRRAAVAAAETVATAAAAAGVAHLVVVTSAMVHGTRPDGAAIGADAEPTGEPDPGLVGDLVDVDQLAGRAARTHPGLRVTRLRPAALVGPGVDSFVTRYFAAPRLLSVREHEMAWQFCHLEDLAAAVLVVLGAGEPLPGALVVGAPGSLTGEEVEAGSGVAKVELPWALATSTAEQLHRVGILPLPVDDLEFVVKPWLVDSAALQALGWSARHDNRACLAEVAATTAERRATSRRLTRKDAAALGVAGAAVAAVATAAVWRNARGTKR